MSDQQLTLLSYVCSEEGHDFDIIGEGYYRRTNNEPDRDKVFRMILCPRCGETREICIKDSSQPAKVVKAITTKKRTIRKTK